MVAHRVQIEIFSFVVGRILNMYIPKVHGSTFLDSDSGFETHLKFVSEPKTIPSPDEPRGSAFRYSSLLNISLGRNSTKSEKLRRIVAQAIGTYVKNWRRENREPRGLTLKGSIINKLQKSHV